MAKELNANRKKIINELQGCQGKPVDMGGYYYPTEETANAAMRPSATFNAIIDAATN
jgi:isocitrate dehydrogenase